MYSAFNSALFKDTVMSAPTIVISLLLDALIPVASEVPSSIMGVGLIPSLAPKAFAGVVFTVVVTSSGRPVCRFSSPCGNLLGELEPQDLL